MHTYTGQAYDPFLPGNASSPARPRPRRSLSRSLGLVRIILLLLGTLVILAVVGFLSFLWRGASEAVGQGDRPVFEVLRVWRRILDSGWLLRLVTMSSLLYRVVAAAQAAVATEMLASLILESGGCLLPDLARLSLTRCQTAGPFQLALAMPQQLRGAANLATAGLLAVLLIVTAATQFTSTILLTDFGAARVVGGPATFNVNFGFTYTINHPSSDESSNLFSPYAGVDYWTSRPPAYLRFAEVSTPPVEEDGVYDTGFTARAFLPFVNSTQRVTVRTYEGPATVVDARVVCIRPRLSTLSVNLTGGSTLSLAGTVALGGTYKGLETMSLETSDFSCPVAMGRANDRPPQRKISLCPVASSPALMQGGVRPDLSTYTSAYLLINSTATPEAWRVSSLIGTRRLTISDLTEASQSQGTWQSLRVKGNPAVGIDATLCFINPIPWDYKIFATGSRDGSEPTLRWNISTGAYSSDAARSLLGAVLAPAAPEDRGLLRLAAPADWSTSNATDAFDTPKTINYIWTALRANAQNVSLSLSQRENKDGEPLLVPHRAHIGLFQDVLAHTGGNAALALQALFFTMLQMAYTDYAAEFDVAAEAAALFSHEAIMPMRWRGFMGFCAVTGTHIALVFAVAVVFFVQTRVSMLGNAWHAMGQVVELAGGETVHAAAQRTDKEVREDLYAAGRAERRVELRLAA
ncbi:hypothetical protein NCS57_00172500 [Fusarium keratoplasticum]|uniref:Uncharacterized protein n=1 Tax=Fusarium keratoplasticum TaxID=1328300 RepID=A0ACC0RHB5_9HYPO|nr:hypothetical protein NCS57_00172500 [Fusarium keratoplasticum]KAI8685045.1 hypothetical protein NCS57_00172500 [Fusarium keratoplasticum]